MSIDSRIKPMGARRVILSPTLYTFPCFTDLAWCNCMNPPPGIEKWSWHSCEEIQKICTETIAPLGFLSDGRSTRQAFSFPNYSDLNRTDPHQDPEITWFLSYEIGYLFRKRSASYCPWNDPLLYIPAKWGMRIIKAVERGISHVTWFGAEKLQARYFDGRPPENVIDLVK